MKKIIIALLIISVVYPVSSNAQVTQSYSSQQTMMQLISSLLEQIKLLQIKLEQQKNIENKESVVEVSLTDKTEYQKKVKPLLNKLDSVEESVSILEQKIEQKKCTRPRWVASKGVRKFTCLSKVYTNSSKEIDKLEEELIDLEEEKKQIEVDINYLKTEFGI